MEHHFFEALRFVRCQYRADYFSQSNDPHNFAASAKEEASALWKTMSPDGRIWIEEAKEYLELERERDRAIGRSLLGKLFCFLGGIVIDQEDKNIARFKGRLSYNEAEEAENEVDDYVDIFLFNLFAALAISDTIGAASQLWRHLSYIRMDLIYVHDIRPVHILIGRLEEWADDHQDCNNLERMIIQSGDYHEEVVVKAVRSDDSETLVAVVLAFLRGSILELNGLPLTPEPPKGVIS